MLNKGWRCLECTVCEACGQATDPGRLLLCDDCDISYHTYCLDPPLQNVPKDSWKCKWCLFFLSAAFLSCLSPFHTNAFLSVSSVCLVIQACMSWKLFYWTAFCCILRNIKHLRHSTTLQHCQLNVSSSNTFLLSVWKSLNVKWMSWVFSWGGHNVNLTFL